MKESQEKILRELNNLSEDVFKLYASGMYYDAMVKATNILNLAKERLGSWHPSLSIYYDNLEYVNKGYQRFGKGQKVNTDNNNEVKVKEIKGINSKEAYLRKLEQYPVSLVGAKNALNQAEIKFGKNHPYVDILNKNIKSIETRQQSYSQPKSKHYKSYQRKGKNKLLKLLVPITLVLVTIYGLSSLVDKIPIKTVAFSSTLSVFQSPFSAPTSSTFKDSNLIDAPLIMQYPELPRGCEVTSLAMLLEHAGVNVDKTTLAKEVKKDPTPYRVINEKTYFGNPDYGFVGSMYSLKQPGLGVYQGPIYELAEAYLPNQAVNLTGRSFEDILYFLSNDIPVWVITNTKFDQLDSKEFEIWYTPYGPIQITYKQHSVLLTGYDEKYIYFNDPLKKGKNQKAPIDPFIKSWNQMGQQAISYIPVDKNLFEIIPID